jgi:rod shape-determining protein MreC
VLKSKLKQSWRFFVPLFLALFFISLLSSKTRRAPWYEQWAWNVVSPVTSILSWSTKGTKKFLNHYLYLIGVEKENERLLKEVGLLRQKTLTLDERASENERFRELLELKRTHWPDSIAAQVIAFDPLSEFKSLRINKGFKDGVETDMPVVALEGLVGKVGPVFANDALILLIVDPSSSVDVLIERSRVRGLLAGHAKKTHLRPGYFLSRLEYLKQTSDIQAGDWVMTSGLDRLFPKGILVGTVESLVNNRFGIFIEAEVVPTVDFTQLEEVFVLKYP